MVTYVGRYNDRIVKEALIREIERKGQVFYLHNFIYDIEKVKKRLQTLVPFAKIEIAHGRMNPETLSDIMKRFSAGERHTYSNHYCGKRYRHPESQHPYS